MPPRLVQGVFGSNSNNVFYEGLGLVMQILSYAGVILRSICNMYLFCSLSCHCWRNWAWNIESRPQKGYRGKEVIDIVIEIVFCYCNRFLGNMVKFLESSSLYFELDFFAVFIMNFPFANFNHAFFI